MMTLFALITSFSIFTNPVDSVGKETINGKVYVLHKVELKETLYGISKRYGTSVEAILQQNPTADAGLDVGQIIKVPYVSSPKKVSNTAGNKHIVAEKETLYSVARLYGLSVDDLRQMNKLTSDALSIGQELIVKRSNLAEKPVAKSNPPVTQSLKGVHTVASKETLFSISRQYSVSVDQLKKWNNLPSNELSLGQTLFVVAPENQGMKTTTTTITEQQPIKTTTQPVQTVTPAEQPKETTPANTNAQPVISAPVKISEAYKDGKEVREAGLAELIEGTQGNRKYLALHRNAPIGTILKVKNQLNDREVFVRVIGQLPDTGGNDKLVIKISKSAYDRLSAIDPKFMVEVTWYK